MGGGVSPFPPPQELMGKGLNEVGLQINPEFAQAEGLQKMLSGPPLRQIYRSRDFDRGGAVDSHLNYSRLNYCSFELLFI